jgi:hypothetical protein
MPFTSTKRNSKPQQKRVRVKHKPKIDWQQLGLKDPAESKPATSIQEIRRQAIMLASQGMGQETLVRSASPRGKRRGADTPDAPTRTRRRGATE